MKLSVRLVASGHSDLAALFVVVIIYDYIGCLKIRVVKSSCELPFYLLLAFITVNAVEGRAQTA